MHCREVLQVDFGLCDIAYLGYKCGKKKWQKVWSIIDLISWRRETRM